MPASGMSWLEAARYCNWLSDRERLFPEDLDRTDPWQFRNVRVS